MALLRVPPLPPATSLLAEHRFHQAPYSSHLSKSHTQSNNLLDKLFLSLYSSSSSSVLSLSPTHTLWSKESKSFLSKFASVAQQVLDSSGENPSSETQQEDEEFSPTRLLAQNVPWTTTHEDVRSLFEKYGKVLDVELSMYNKTRNRGFAFVTMGSPQEALAALNNLESYVLEGRMLKVNYARPKKQKTQPPPQPKAVTFNLFVANLSYEARSKHLKEFFDLGSSGAISAEVIFRDNPRRSSGYGFVSFKSKKEADTALSHFQGKIFMGRPISVARSKQFVEVPSSEPVNSKADELYAVGAEPEEDDPPS